MLRQASSGMGPVILASIDTSKEFNVETYGYRFSFGPWNIQKALTPSAPVWAARDLFSDTPPG